MDKGLRWKPRSAERALIDDEEPIAIPDPQDPDLARVQAGFWRLPPAVRKFLGETIENY